MITKKDLIEAGAGANVHIIGYYHAHMRAPAAATPTVKEYALVKHPVAGTVPELYENVNYRDLKRISQGLSALETFMQIVQNMTMAEVT